MLAKGPLHLVVHVPPSRQVLGLHGLLEVPAPRPDELLQLHEVAVLAPTEDGFGHLLSVGIGLLAVAQPYWLELFLEAVVEQLECVLEVLVVLLGQLLRDELTDAGFLLQ